jgi:hypothetical protein
VRYELSFYIPEDGILHSHCRENLKSYEIATMFDINGGLHLTPSANPIQGAN